MSAEPNYLPERALKTLLLTDLVGSTALVDTLGDERAAVVFSRHDHLARDLFVMHEGTEIDKTDGFLILFDRPIDAALCALEMHDELAKLSGELGVSLTVRAGIHLGEVVLRRNRPEFVARGAKPIEVEGLAKPTAARIMSLAAGTQTLMTRTAFDLARRAAVGHASVPDDIEWIEHGPYQFKGIAEPQSVCEVGRRDRAPLTAPQDSEKAWHSGAPFGPESTIGWRPAVGLAVPGRDGWTLKQKLGQGSSTELWVARVKGQSSTIEATIGLDAADDLGRPNDRALLYELEPEGGASSEGPPVWCEKGSVSCVVVTSGEQKGVYAVLKDEPFSAGRDVGMDLQIDDPKVSRQHFEIRRVHDVYVIRELRARNGVFVNDLKIDGERRLDNGAYIRVGRTELVFYEQA